MRTVVVTGGAGYVGSILIGRLLREGYEVVCIDNLRFGGSALMSVWDHPGFLFSRTDITDFARVDRVLDATSDCYALVHLAAIVGDPACALEPELAERTNRDASLNLLRKAAQSRVERFVFASTCSNYGKMAAASGYVDEGSPLAPVSLYARLKVEVETRILDEMGKAGPLCATCLRFATVYGVSPRMRFDLTVNEFTKELALRRELTVFGEQFWRPYCYVGDFSSAILAALAAPAGAVAGKVFNVGDTAENYTKRMLVEELSRRLPDAAVRYVDKLEDPRDYRVSFDRIRDELGFRISKTVPDGIDDVLSCIRSGIIDDPDDQRYYNTPPSR